MRPRESHMFGLMWPQFQGQRCSASRNRSNCSNRNPNRPSCNRSKNPLISQQLIVSYRRRSCCPSWLLLLLLLQAALLAAIAPAACAAASPWGSAAQHHRPLNSSTARILVLLERTDVPVSEAELTSGFNEYARLLGRWPRPVSNDEDDDSSSRKPQPVVFRVCNGLGDLWARLNDRDYSTIIYAMNSTRDAVCAMATELAAWQQRVLFWPCSSAQSTGSWETPEPEQTPTRLATTTRSTATMPGTRSHHQPTTTGLVDAVRHVLGFMNATQVSIVTKNNIGDWVLPVSVAVDLTGIPYQIVDYADAFNDAPTDNNATASTTTTTTTDKLPGCTVIITTADPAVVTLLQRHVRQHSTASSLLRAVLIDIAGTAVVGGRRHRTDTCSGVSGGGTRAWQHNPPVINSSNTTAPGVASKMPLPSSPSPAQPAPPRWNQSSIYLLTVLSTDFARYLDLLMLQPPIEDRHQADNQAANLDGVANPESAAGGAGDGRGRRRPGQRSTRRRRALQIANEIQSTAATLMNSSSDTAPPQATAQPPSPPSPSPQLSPEIVSRIKQFYSLAGRTQQNQNQTATATEAASATVYDYCQRFVSVSYALDENTTQAVCRILLHDDDLPELAAPAAAAAAAGRSKRLPSQPEAKTEAKTNDDDDRRGATIASARIIHTVECVIALRWFALFDYIIANGWRWPTAGGDQPSSASVPEFNLLHYWAPTGDWHWPAALHIPTAARQRPAASVAAAAAEAAAEAATNGGGGGLLAASAGHNVAGGVAGVGVGAVYVNWISDGLQMFWQCGAHCWTLTSLVVLVLLVVTVGCVVAVISFRNYMLKKRLSSGPNKIVLSAEDFVFPVEGRRVDEGIEAMLCTWLHQLQEFGGPEVEKPDLLQGSIGSLKNLGVATATTMASTATVPAVATTTTTMTATSATTPGTVTAAGGGIGAVTRMGSTTGGSIGAGIGAESGSGSMSKLRSTLDMRARYNGDLVQIKDFTVLTSGDLKSRAMDQLRQMQALRHENINPLIGWLTEPTRHAIVFECCSRGSLQDVLIMDDIKLDWSFRLSLLTDLVRGMRYLHASAIRLHGSLTSRNCVVDARWVLKITDYGMQHFCDAQGVQTAAKSAKELLWTAPEIVRRMRGSPQLKSLGTQMGDVYSFGIIMQEVVVRGEPYCMLALSPEEIIAKIEKPPPLIRPSVSKGAAPPEAINIMRQCWAESPDMRPDFNSVYERFKQLNHGRKVNFVDTMFQMLEKYSNNLEELIRERTAQLEMERKKTESLLNRMLPSTVAEKLKMGLTVEPEEFSDVTIYFSDIVGFTTIAAHCTPVEVVDLLNDLYTCFDDTINAYSVYKVETIGDAYMVVSGLPERIANHAEQIATMALDLLHQSGNFHVKHLPDVPLQLRIGLHTGPCCAGVVGLTMPRYCLFGDTVNTASRMESTGSSWRIHLSEATRDRLVKAGGYQLEPRGPIEIKGKGQMNTYWLLGKSGFDKVLPTPPPIGESHGLAECLLRNVQPTGAACGAAGQPERSRPMLAGGPVLRQSSSQSSSAGGAASGALGADLADVKVEITPPQGSEDFVPAQHLTNSFSLDSTATLNAVASLNLNDFKTSTTPFASPAMRKMADMPAASLEGGGGAGNVLLSAAASLQERTARGGGGAAAGAASGGGSTSANKLYKKIEAMMDLSLPYNHYKCLSACPSELNLTQYNQSGEHHRFVYATVGSGVSMGGVGGGIVGGGSSTRLESRPGSSRLLRRQFSLDRDDSAPGGGGQQQQQMQQHYRHNLEIPTLQEHHRMSPTNSAKSVSSVGGGGGASGGGGGSGGGLGVGRLLKQHSTSVAVDLEKIEEIPISPTSVMSGSKSNSGLQTQISEDTSGSRTPERGTMLTQAQRRSAEISLTVDALIVR